MGGTVENERRDDVTGANAPTRNPGVERARQAGRQVEGIRRDERTARRVEIIGYDHPLGAEPSEVMTSRLYTDTGDTLTYTHEADDNGVTSSFGDRGSPTVFKAAAGYLTFAGTFGFSS